MRIPFADEYDLSHMSLNEAAEWTRLAGPVLDLMRRTCLDDMDPVFAQMVIENPGDFTPDDIRMEVATAEADATYRRAVE